MNNVIGVGFMNVTRKELVKMIDHTQLKPDATYDEIEKLCKEALKYGFYSVVINPSFVPYASKLVKGSDVKLVSVVGFPLGASTTEVKAFETRDLVEKGCDEVDMVINIGALKSREYEVMTRDIKAVVEAAQGASVKVIIETCYLTDEEKIKACEFSKKAGASFVKTSTGFGPSGALASDVKLMRMTVGRDMGVKAAGGIRDFKTTLKMVEAGANRIGASHSVSIIEEISKT